MIAALVGTGRLDGLEDVIDNAALALFALAVLTAALAMLALVWRKAFDRLTLRAGPVSVDLAAIDRVLQVAESTHEQVEQINRQVNHVPPDAPTLQDRVGAIEEGQRWLLAAVYAVAAHIGVELPDQPSKETP